MVTRSSQLLRFLKHNKKIQLYMKFTAIYLTLCQYLFYCIDGLCKDRCPYIYRPPLKILQKVFCLMHITTQIISTFLLQNILKVVKIFNYIFQSGRGCINIT